MSIKPKLFAILACLLISATAFAGQVGLDDKKKQGTELKQLENQIRGLKTSPKINSGGISGSDKRHALVVGNNKYENLPTLVKAVGDAETNT